MPTTYGPVTIRFVTGAESRRIYPRSLRGTALQTRFAVIQDSHREGDPDMYFDEGLWRRLVSFAGAYSPTGQVMVADRHEDIGKAEAPLETFLARFSQTSAAEREPPAVIVRDQGEIILAVVPEIWAAVGGPAPYHDSYTYSIFSKQDLGRDVVSFLIGSDEASDWDIEPEILTAGPRRPSLWRWMLGQRLA